MNSNAIRGITALACLAAALLVAGSSAATPGGDRTATALQRGADALVAHGAPGVVLLTRGRHHTLTVTSGLGEIGTATPMRANDRFRVVSLADFEYDPTVLAPYLAGVLSHPWAPRELVQIAVSHPPLFAPGTDESYSSTNYLLAGLIVEARTGHTLGSELNRRVFRPLHLHATSFPTTARMPNPHAHSYLVIDRPPATDVTGLYPFPWAAGAIVSNAADTATFYGALLSGRLLSPRLLHAMETTHAQKHVDVAGQRYGLGLQKYPTACGTAWGHAGAYPGYYAYNFTSTDGRRQAVLEVNADPTSVGKATLLESIRLLAKAYCTAPLRSGTP
jgi:D-alanyl-D-alanine carboxypeptidase